MPLKKDILEITGGLLVLIYIFFLFAIFLCLPDTERVSVCGNMVWGLIDFLKEVFK